MLFQSESAECGLACIGMVLNHYGRHIDMAALRAQNGLSLKGVTLRQLIEVARCHGLVSRPLRLELKELKQLQLPCILHWQLNHFVVMIRINGNILTIKDPAVGLCRISLEEVSRKFTGVALELSPGVDFRQERAKPSVSFRQLAGSIGGLKRSLLQILLLSLALQVFSLVSPLLTQGIMDHVLVRADTDLLTVLIIAFVMFLVLQTSVSLMRTWAGIHLSMQLGLQWNGNVLAHLLRLPVDFFQKRHLGDITSRMGSVGAIQNMITSSAVSVVLDGLMAITTLLVMMKYSPQLMLVSVAALLLYFGVRLATYRMFRQANEEQMVLSARQQTHLLESLRGATSIKLMGHESQRHGEWMNHAVATQNQSVRIAKMNMIYGTVNGLIFGVENIVVLAMGAHLVLGNAFSIGMLVAYLSYKGQFSGRITGLIDTFVGFKLLRLHGERLADIVLTPPEDDQALPEALPPQDVRIEVRNLSFRYAEGEPWVLRDCSFSIAPGESVAIIGVSGCGKTTLVKLLLGLLKPSEGSIHVGGHDLHKLGARNVRAIVGAVMQDDQLFAGSIADNIGFFDPEFDLERVEQAARLAAVHEDIAAMPMGYHGLIGDMGSSLSGGQKQRIILARALYRQPKLLFLDEATSHLDVGNEQLVNTAIRRLQVTRVIVAHRPETIASADRVLVMEQGRIVQELRPQTACDAPAGEVEHAM
ncbi:peptidase domain-containing ABC transporter [Stenotrophomonas acidaminiphila]|uniref:peptidase domain-containing ABC transporter n=1 Tax=Stenotrophomonas acidaminiphila TaxID=128780 RepID=UPI0015F7F9E9|nr:peptidase domain-containing ABC transporter [Stenotrophomonas acidaminiphila]